MMDFDTFRKLPYNVGDLGKIIIATGFEWFPKVQKLPNLVTLTVILLLKVVLSG